MSEENDSSPAANALPAAAHAEIAHAPAAVPQAPAAVPPAAGQRFRANVADQKFGGVLAGVRFKAGVAFTDNPHQAFSLRNFGAVVEDRNPPSE